MVLIGADIGNHPSFVSDLHQQRTDDVDLLIQTHQSAV
jgi:hypothetical protein